MSARRQWIKRSLIAAAVLGVAVVGAGMMGKGKPKGPVELFDYAQVDEGPISQVVTASGQLQPTTSITIGSQVSGTVIERLVDFNDRVKAGQVLLRLDPATLQARLKQAEAAARSAKATLALAKTTLERNERLVAQGFVSAQALEQNKREVEAGLASVESAQAQVDAARTDLGNTIIRSPVDGIIIRRNIDVGQTVAASFQTPDLFTVAPNLDKMRIVTSVNEGDVGQIKEGQEVRFTVDAYPDREFTGKVEQFRLTANNNQGVVTYPIVVEVKNEDGLLKPGMTAQTKVVVASKSKALRMPTAALRYRPDEVKLKAAGASYAVKAVAEAAKSEDGVFSTVVGGVRQFKVYTKGAQGEPVLHKVTIGVANNKYTEVLSGDLKAGDQLITRMLDDNERKAR